MEKHSLKIIIVAILIFLLNIFVFFSMSDYVSRQGNFVNQVMFYLTIILIIGSFLLSYIGYRDLSELSFKKKMMAHIIFFTHFLLVAIFIGTIWFVNL